MLKVSTSVFVHKYTEYTNFGQTDSLCVQIMHKRMMMQKWGLHEALPKWHFENIMVFFKVAYKQAASS